MKAMMSAKPVPTKLTFLKALGFLKHNFSTQDSKS